MERVDMELDGHEAGRLVADDPRAETLADMRIGDALF